MKADAERAPQAGFVAIEWVAAVTLLLFPVVVLVATIPSWAERRQAATVAAREAARELVRTWPVPDDAGAQFVAATVARDHGVAADEIAVHVVAGSAARGGTVRVDVAMRMPAIALPGVRPIGAWTYTATATRRIDDYRSR